MHIKLGEFQKIEKKKEDERGSFLYSLENYALSAYKI